jgi:cyclase
MIGEGDSGTLQETALSDRLVVLTFGGASVRTSFGVNCVAFASADGTLLVDPMVAPGHAQRVEEALRRRGFPEVRHVVVTHHHTDHALGAGWFARRGATVVAHRRCAAEMAAQHPTIIAARRRARDEAVRELFGDANPFVPGVRFEDRRVLELGDAAVEVLHLGPGHTAGDAVVLFPSEGAVACGDLVFAGYHFNYEDADAAALPRRLEELAALPAPRVVPGHGPCGGRELLDDQARYHREVERIVRAAPGAADARAEVEARFADLALREVIPTGLRAYGADGA